MLPSLFEKANSIDLNSRHGAVLAIGEIVHALSKTTSNLQNLIGPTLTEQIKGLVGGFYNKLYFRGLGGELMRQACCDFIEKCSLAAIGFHNDDVIGMLFIDTCQRLEVILMIFRPMVVFDQ